MCRNNYRSGFTLMEMMISVVLIVIISLFLTQGITTLQHSNRSLKAHDDVEATRDRLFSLLYYDLLEAYSVTILPTKERRYQVIQMQTGHSIHQIIHPYVTYYVKSDTLALIRLESAYPIKLPIAYELQQQLKADLIVEEVSDFNLYPSVSTLAKAAAKEAKAKGANKTKDANTTKAITSYYLLYLNTKTLNSPLMFEVAKP